MLQPSVTSLVALSDAKNLSLNPLTNTEIVSIISCLESLSSVIEQCLSNI